MLYDNDRIYRTSPEYRNTYRIHGGLSKPSLERTGHVKPGDTRGQLRPYERKERLSFLGVPKEIKNTDIYHARTPLKRRIRVQAVPSAQETTELPTRMNSTPHPREMRRFFYTDAAKSVVAAIADGHTRMKIRCTIPELNPEMDVYRVGTLLEWVREVATMIAEDGVRVKVCVQGSMGQGVFQGLPLSLSGVSRIMRAMDWGPASEFVSFGAVGASEVDECDAYVLIAPQNIVGNTIITDLSEMVEAAETAGKKMVLINPILKDIPSHSGIMGVRGREGRNKFADSFLPVYHFRLLYRAGSFYPIKGALRHTFNSPWQVYKRVDLPQRQEEYQLWGQFESEPSGGQITECLQLKLSLADRKNAPAKSSSTKWW